MSKSVRSTYVEGLALANAFQFIGYAKDKRGSERVAVEVQQDTILALANALRFTDSSGHAAWHVMNPQNAMPCSTCDRRGSSSASPTGHVQENAQSK